MSREYEALVIATFKIRAENIAEARRVAAGLKVIGERSGSRRPGRHDRDYVHYSAERQSVQIVTKPKPHICVKEPHKCAMNHPP